MDTALTIIVALVGAIALLDLAAAAFGADSRDGFVDDRIR